MGSVLYGADDIVADLVLSLLPGRKWTNFVALGVVRRGSLYGGVVFHDYYPRSGDIQISAAFKGAAWCTPWTLRTIVDFPLRQLKCRRVTMSIAANNSPSRAFAERCGARLEGTIRGGHDGTIDRLIYGMLLPDELKLRLPGGLYARLTDGPGRS